MALSKEDKQHLVNITKYEKRVRRLYEQANARALALGLEVDFDPTRDFHFEDYMLSKNKADKLFEWLRKGLKSTITAAVIKEWELADLKNDALVVSKLGKKEMMKKIAQDRYFGRNNGALKSFLTRKEQGLNLSDRVWNYTEQYKEEIELGIELGLRTGRSAAEMSRDIRLFLKRPDMLFREVMTATDDKGERVFELSRAAKAYKPGRGVYRSSYKNALRLTATETNMAYRAADNERWQTMDFVIGQHVIRSNNHTVADMCNELSGANEEDKRGRYPKDFKYVGWHPLCRCFVVPLMVDIEEMEKQRDAILRGEEYECKGEKVAMPKEFDEWVQKNEGRIRKKKVDKLPYFLRENEQYMNAALSKGKKKTAKEIAKERHAARTEEDVERIKERWKERGEKRAAKAKTATDVDYDKVRERAKERQSKRTPDDVERIKSEWEERTSKLAAKERLPKTLRNLDAAIAEYEKTDKYGDVAREHKEEIEELMKEVFAKHDFGMNIEVDTLGKVIDSHFKNTFEVGKSGGYLGSMKTSGQIETTHDRLIASHKMFGLSKDLKNGQLARGEYEKYGSVLDCDIERSINSLYAAQQYGDIEVRFRKNKVTPTWTAGDSLRRRYQPSLVSDPKSCSFDNLPTAPTSSNIDVSDFNFFRDMHAKSYFELQYHGTLTVDCVESITFPYDITQISRTKEIAIAKRWKKIGARIFYLDKDFKLAELLTQY